VYGLMKILLAGILGDDMGHELGYFRRLGGTRNGFGDTGYKHTMTLLKIEETN
jgi:hypothetical protein